MDHKRGYEAKRRTVERTCARHTKRTGELRATHSGHGRKMEMGR